MRYLPSSQQYYPSCHLEGALATACLDEDLARVYQVTTKAFNQAIKRNIDRFPEDFMFKLTPEEYATLRSQIVILKPPILQWLA